MLEVTEHPKLKEMHDYQIHLLLTGFFFLFRMESRCYSQSACKYQTAFIELCVNAELAPTK